MEKTLRILFVGLPDSIHSSRWISQLEQQNWDLHLFPGEPVDQVGINSRMRNVVVHDVLNGRPVGADPTIRVADDFWPFMKDGWPFPRGSWRARRFVQRWIPAWQEKAWSLAQTIRKLQPDIIHSLGIQHGGYLALDCRKYIHGAYAPWIVSNWGNDIYLFGRLSQHEKEIRAVLSFCDYFTCDCQRDMSLARAFGFSGQLLPIFPVAGGYDILLSRSLGESSLPSSRRLVLLKGYQNWYGRALVGLRAIELCKDLLKGYRLAIYSASSDVRLAAKLVTQSTGLAIEIVPPCSHEEMLRLNGQARISLGLSLSDGLPNSMLEAMIMGAFPIQSNTSGAGDVITSGQNGELVHPEDSESLARVLRRALVDDQLVDRAAEINARLSSERFDRSVIEPQVIAMYQRIGGQTQLRQSKITERMSSGDDAMSSFDAR